MALVDMELAHLENYRPEVPEPADFDAFWGETLAETCAHDLALEVVDVDSHLTAIDVLDVTFAGFGGDPIKAWFKRPHGATGPLATVVEYIGYGGGRGLPHERLDYAAAGYAHLLMDSRGQGGGWGSGGDTADSQGSAPATPGFMTRGILDPHDYYYRRLIADAVRAVEAAAALPQVDPRRIVVAGGSQGGGITTAVAGLVPEVAGAMIDVPFLAAFPRALDICETHPYAEIVRYLSVRRDHTEAVRTTLSYIDGVNFAKRAQAPALYSVGLMDDVCPPSTVFASYNEYAGPKQIAVYPFNGHEGGGEFHAIRRFEWLADRVGH